MINKNHMETVMKYNDCKEVFRESTSDRKECRLFDPGRSEVYRHKGTVRDILSDRNWNNIFANNPDLLRPERFKWPKITMTYLDCTGHENMSQVNVDKPRLYQRNQRRLKKSFTPPVFENTGIAICPNPSHFDSIDEAEKAKRDEKNRERTSQKYALQHDEQYLTPGNMEFIEFTYPIVNHLWRYTTYAIPNNRSDWEWMFKHMMKIKNSFIRKYLCTVSLATEPGYYKGHIAYLVKFEGETQGHILQCRSGLPKFLKDIMVEPANAYRDIECYVSEYLIKRKYIFKMLKNAERHERFENKDLVISSIQDRESVESAGDDPNQPSNFLKRINSSQLEIEGNTRPANVLKRMTSSALAAESNPLLGNFLKRIDTSEWGPEGNSHPGNLLTRFTTQDWGTEEMTRPSNVLKRIATQEWGSEGNTRPENILKRMDSTASVVKETQPK